MRLGIYVNGYGTPTRSSGTTSLHEAEEQTQLAEAVGLDWVVLGERHLHRPGHHEILTTAAWLAALTHRIGIATAGIVLPFYQPYFLAQALANIDAASGGRLTAGFVLGYRREEFEAMGVSFATRAAQFEASLETVQSLWAGETVELGDGPTGTRTAFVSPLPGQSPRPPIWNGGRVTAALRRTAWSCDGWTTSFNEDLPSLERAISTYLGLPSGPRSLGKSVIICRDGFCADSSQAARATLEDPLLRLHAEYAQWKRDSVDADRYSDLTWDAVQPRLVVGSPAQMVEQLAVYSDVGADGVILRIQPPELAHLDAMRCLELIGDKVVPALAEIHSSRDEHAPSEPPERTPA